MYKIQKINSLIDKKIEKQIVILDLQSGLFYSLNEVAGVIWKYIRVPRTEAEILNHLLKYYEGEVSKVKKDLKKFIDEYNGSLLEIK